MNIQKDVSLADYSTMHIGGLASYLVEIDSKEMLVEALDWAKDKSQDIIMIGGGSNTFWKDEGFHGLVIVNRILKFEITKEDGQGAKISVGSGEHWDDVVETCCNRGLSGIECLSLIPGSTGATPVQNVGAYGQEISSILESIEAYDTKNQSYVSLDASDCGFSYRNSRFKDEPGRFYITEINLSLKKTPLRPPFYGSLEHYLITHNITDYSPNSIRQAVIAIRQSKLPDPAKVNNCGSFFANPIISTSHLERLQRDLNVEIPHWPTSSGEQKIAAGWLVENIGYKGYHDPVTGMSTWPNQALVLVNESAKSTADVLAFRNQIVDKIKSKFDITLIQEPQLLP